MAVAVRRARPRSGRRRPCRDRPGGDPCRGGRRRVIIAAESRLAQRHVRPGCCAPGAGVTGARWARHPPAATVQTSLLTMIRARSQNEPAPSLHPDYRGFITTTGRSVSVCRFGTQRLTVSAAQRTPFRRRRLSTHMRLYRHSPSHVPCRRRRPDSRHLNAGHHLANRRALARLIPAPFNRLFRF